MMKMEMNVNVKSSRQNRDEQEQDEAMVPAALMASSWTSASYIA